jgi:ABC-2 type transport system ATP-binding protein
MSRKTALRAGFWAREFLEGPGQGWFFCSSLAKYLHTRPVAMDAILKTEKLRVEYPVKQRGSGNKVALQGLDLTVRAGEVFGFLGPNGAGKTTTMNVLLGFVQATSGAAYLFGVDVRKPIARQRIGYLPELTYYYKFLTAEEILRFYAKVFSIPRAEADRRIDSLLKLVELEHARSRPLKSYSKGMQQRVGLAQALINNPDLLILDEPTSGSDPLGRMKVRQIIQRLKDEGKTVFFSSHELGEVETVCDRVAIVHQGELKVEGRVDDLVRQHQCDLEKVFLKIVGYEGQV